jgi:transcriptional regulator with XRE-family HTH domain
MSSIAVQPIGGLLREWRQRRRLSQLALACDAEISTRHLSFIESGRSSPSRQMILHLSEQLGIPLRERNLLLVAGGFAPAFPEQPLNAHSMEAERKAMEQVLKGHEPYPALLIDRRWALVSANAGVPRLLAGVDSKLLQPPVNALRLSLHPDGLAPRIRNLSEWRTHVFDRLKRQIEATADSVLIELLNELRGYPAPPSATPPPKTHAPSRVVVPFELVVDGNLLRFFSTTTVFGTPLDITLSELALESFFPADDATAKLLRA